MSDRSGSPLRRITRRLLDWVGGEAPRPDCGEARPRIGILTYYAARKGCTTLSRTVEEALGGRPSVFPVRKLSRVDRELESLVAPPVEDFLDHDQVVRPGTRLVDWLDELDILIVVERLMPTLFRRCRARGTKVLFILLLDYLPEDEAERRAGLELVDEVVSFTEQGCRVLAEDGFDRSCHVPAALGWPVVEPRPVNERLTFYFNVGVGGFLNRRNVPLVMETFGDVLAEHPELALVLKMLPAARKYLGAIAIPPQAEVIEASLSTEEMVALQQRVDVSLFPSRFEGLGYPLLESLYSAVPVIATDAPPMNEFVEHGVNGLVVKATRAGIFGLQTIHDLDPADFKARVLDFAGESGRELCERLKVGAHERVRTRRAAYESGWRAVIGRHAPRVAVLGDGGAQQGVLDLSLEPRSGGLCCAVDRLPLEDEALDELIARESLGRVSTAATGALLGEWRRVLRVGGRLRIETVDLAGLAEDLTRGRLDSTEFSARLLAPGGRPGARARAFDEATLTALLAASGFEQIRRRPAESGRLVVEARRSAAGV